MYTEVKTTLKSLKEHAMKITNTENKKIIPLTNEQYESYLNQILHKYKNTTNLNINTLTIKLSKS